MEAATTSSRMSCNIKHIMHLGTSWSTYREMLTMGNVAVKQTSSVRHETRGKYRFSIIIKNLGGVHSLDSNKESRSGECAFFFFTLGESLCCPLSSAHRRRALLSREDHPVAALVPIEIRMCGAQFDRRWWSPTGDVSHLRSLHVLIARCVWQAATASDTDRRLFRLFWFPPSGGSGGNGGGGSAARGVENLAHTRSATGHPHRRRVAAPAAWVPGADVRDVCEAEALISAVGWW